MHDISVIAVFIDFENLAHGVKDENQGDFQIDLVLKRLLEKGRIAYKRAYCDWSRFESAVRQFHIQGIELVNIPQTRISGKNSADIRMVVDALDLCYTKEHIDIFVLVSGDSDFSPLASKLKENDKLVIGCGVKASTSDLLITSCDEFIYYDDLYRAAQKKPPAPKQQRRTGKKQEAIDRLMEVMPSLVLEYDPLWGSVAKQAINRIYPGFNEGYYGYRSFTELLKDAQTQGLIELEYDKGRGNYEIHLDRR